MEARNADAGSPHRPVVAVMADEADLPPALDAVGRIADVRVATSRQALAEALADAEVLLVYDFRSRELRDLWPSARRVRWVHTTSAGVDAIAFPELADSGVAVTNAAGVFDEPMAEFVLGVVLLFAKDLLTTLALQREATWRHRDAERLAGTRALVVGAGGVGRAIARLLAAVGVEVEVVARRAREDDELGTIHAIDDLDRRLPHADWVVLAVPLTDATHGLMDADRLARMRPSARLVNVARGEVVDEEALLAALEAGRLAGAALDVFRQEPLPPDHPFWRRPDVVVSPHMSGDVVGWRERLIEQFVDNLHRWTAGEPLHNTVDLSAYVHSGARQP